MKLNIIKVGKTITIDDEIVLIIEGDLPAECVVIFLDKESWTKVKKELEE